MYFEATDAPSGLGTRIMLPGAAPSGTLHWAGGVGQAWVPRAHRHDQILVATHHRDRSDAAAW